MGHQDTPVSRGARAWWSPEDVAQRVCMYLLLYILASLFCRETKDCQDHEALRVLWESQAT